MDWYYDDDDGPESAMMLCLDCYQGLAKKFEDYITDLEAFNEYRDSL